MAPYRYEPLPPSTPGNHYFRLIDILPSSHKTDKLTLHLRTVRLEDCPEYECLSYVWGQQSPSYNISITTTDSTSKSWDHPIGKSLHDALRILQSQTHKRTIWADAICINQSDIEERSNQVCLMGMIFWSAFHVPIWLGPDPDNHATAAFKTIQPISAAHWSYNDTIPKFTPTDVAALPPSPWHSVSTLYKLPWFERAWVQQELGLSRTASFHWGNHPPVDIRDVFGFDIWMEHVGEPLRARFIHDASAVRGARNLWLQYGQVTRSGWLPDDEARDRHLDENPFLVVLADASACRATDPRDHVYAFLGHPAASRGRTRQHRSVGYEELLQHTRETIVVSDYSKSVEEVYLELATRLLWHHGDLVMFGAVCHTAESIVSDYASWVPRWDIIDGEVAMVSGWAWPSRIRDPSGDDVPMHVYGYTLRVRGLIMTAVMEVLDWTDELRRETKSKILNRERSLSLHVGLVNRRRVFRTQDGLEGLVQDVVAEGDVVALLMGAHAPCVLRKVRDKDGEFVLVGTCVMFGISDERLQDIVNERAEELHDILLV